MWYFSNWVKGFTTKSNAAAKYAIMKNSWKGPVLDALEKVKRLCKSDDNEAFHLEDQQKVECIYDVVDHHGGSSYQRSVWLTGRVLHSPIFRITIVVAMLLDSVVVGLQTIATIEEQYGALLTGTSKFFLTLFIMEVFIKWHHDFLGYWKVGWNIFDFTVIFTSFLVPSYLNSSPLKHTMKVLHATRSLRLISVLPGLQPVVRTVVYSIPGVINVLSLLLIWMFSFAILGISWFGSTCPVHFRSFERALFSLFVCITQDGWVDIKNELKSCASPVQAELYLIVFITIGAFILANLVVAIVVTNLELVITQERNLNQSNTFRSSQPKEKPLGRILACNVLLEVAQSPKNLNQENLDQYFKLVAELDKRFAEFKKLKKKLVKEVCALENLEERYDEDDTEAFSHKTQLRDRKSLQSTSQRAYSSTIRKISELVSRTSLTKKRS